MAEQAQKEPTMEEILSSIRKIIADDDAPQETTEAAADVEDLSVFEDDGPEPEPMESEEDVLAAISQSMDEVAEELESEAPTDAAEEDDFEFVVEDESFESFEEDEFDGVEEFVEAEVELEPVEDSFDPVPEPEVKEDIPMTASAAPLTDTATVTAAAGALGKLLANVEFGEEAGGATTIEGLVREMLRPMLKEWLDENLPGIVEKHVEAEVQRIARMAG